MIGAEAVVALCDEATRAVGTLHKLQDRHGFEYDLDLEALAILAQSIRHDVREGGFTPGPAKPVEVTGRITFLGLPLFRVSIEVPPGGG